MTGEEIQIENGYTRIHPAILEALAQTRLSGQELRAVLFLLRQTYGWQKKEDAISLSQWAKGLGLKHRHHVMPILAALVAKHIIYQNGTDPHTHSAIYGFNKYTEQWLDEPVTPQGNGESVTPQRNTPVTPQRNTPVTSQGNRSVTPQGNYKRKKDTFKDKSKDKGTPTEQQRLFGAIVACCEVDEKLLASRIGKTAKDLSAAGYTAEDVDAFRAWWNVNDWRGQKNEPPTLALLVSTINRSKVTTGAPPNDKTQKYREARMANGELVFVLEES